LTRRKALKVEENGSNLGTRNLSLVNAINIGQNTPMALDYDFCARSREALPWPNQIKLGRWISSSERWKCTRRWCQTG